MTLDVQHKDQARPQSEKQDCTFASRGQAVAGLRYLAHYEAEGSNLKGSCGGSLICCSSRYAERHKCHLGAGAACAAAYSVAASEVHAEHTGHDEGVFASDLNWYVVHCSRTHRSALREAAWPNGQKAKNRHYEPRQALPYGSVITHDMLGSEALGRLSQVMLAMLPSALLPARQCLLLLQPVSQSKPCLRQAVMVQAAAAPMAPPAPAVSLRVVSAADLSQQELQELTARPRIDFASILDTVGGWGCSVLCYLAYLKYERPVLGGNTYCLLVVRLYAVPARLLSVADSARCRWHPLWTLCAAGEMRLCGNTLSALTGQKSAHPASPYRCCS